MDHAITVESLQRDLDFLIEDRARLHAVHLKLISGIRSTEQDPRGEECLMPDSGATTLIWINATFFCGGVVLDANKNIIDAPPIIRWSINKPSSELFQWLKRKGALTSYAKFDLPRA